MRNKFFAGILGLITFLFTVNSLFSDAASTAQNLAWVYNWSKTLGISQSMSDLFSDLKLFINIYGFYFVLGIVALIIYRKN